MTASQVTGSAAFLRLVRAHVWRGALIWLAVHVFLGIATGDFSALGIRGLPVTALIAFLVSVVDSRRRREHGFLGNLGVSWTIPPSVAALAVFLLEIISVSLRTVLS